MQSKQIAITLIIIAVIMSLLYVLLLINRNKKWKFQPEKYRYIPDKNEPWNLKQLLYNMVDERFLVIMFSMYLLLVLVIEILFFGGIMTGTAGIRLYVMSLIFPIWAIGMGVFFYISIKKVIKVRDYIQELVKNSLQYADCLEEEFIRRLEEDIKDGLLFHTKKVNFSQHYMFISNSSFAFSPIAIALNDIEEVRYDRHIKGGVFIVKCLMKDKREIRVAFSNMVPAEFISMIRYFGIKVQW